MGTEPKGGNGDRALGGGGQSLRGGGGERGTELKWVHGDRA